MPYFLESTLSDTFGRLWARFLESKPYQRVQQGVQACAVRSEVGCCCATGTQLSGRPFSAASAQLLQAFVPRRLPNSD